MKEYLDFWKEKGLDYIVPEEKKNPEGFDLAPVFGELIGFDRVLEVGAGTGRLARYFHHRRYLGTDINPAALEIAKKNNPKHRFQLNPEYNPDFKPDVALLYTVALHIPDEYIAEILGGICEFSPRVIIAEIMNPKYRENRDKTAAYDVSNQRAVEEYIALMRRVGFKLKGAIVRPYAHYPGEDITFAVFDRIGT